VKTHGSITNLIALATLLRFLFLKFFKAQVGHARAYISGVDACHQGIIGLIIEFFHRVKLVSGDVPLDHHLSITTQRSFKLSVGHEILEVVHPKSDLDHFSTTLRAIRYPATAFGIIGNTNLRRFSYSPSFQVPPLPYHRPLTRLLLSIFLYTVIPAFSVISSFPIPLLWLSYRRRVMDWFYQTRFNALLVAAGRVLINFK